MPLTSHRKLNAVQMELFLLVFILPGWAEPKHTSKGRIGILALAQCTLPCHSVLIR